MKPEEDVACPTCGLATCAGTGKQWGALHPWLLHPTLWVPRGASVPDSIAWSCVGAQSKH